MFLQLKYYVKQNHDFKDTINIFFLIRSNKFLLVTFKKLSDLQLIEDHPQHRCDGLQLWRVEGAVQYREAFVQSRGIRQLLSYRLNKYCIII